MGKNREFYFWSEKGLEEKTEQMSLKKAVKSIQSKFLENKDNVKNPFTRETIQPDVIEKALIKIEILEDNNVLDLIEQDYEINNNKINIMLENILHKLNNMNFLNLFHAKN